MSPPCGGKAWKKTKRDRPNDILLLDNNRLHSSFYSYVWLACHGMKLRCAIAKKAQGSGGCQKKGHRDDRHSFWRLLLVASDAAAEIAALILSCLYKFIPHHASRQQPQFKNRVQRIIMIIKTASGGKAIIVYWFFLHFQLRLFVFATRQQKCHIKRYFCLRHHS